MYLPTRSPRIPAEQLAFLPHPHPNPHASLGSPVYPTSSPLEASSSTGPGTYAQPQLHRSPRMGSGRARQRSNTGSGSTSPRVRSAPASPSGRALPGGLAPLSVISPIKLGASLPRVSMGQQGPADGRERANLVNGHGTDNGMDGVLRRPGRNGLGMGDIESAGAKTTDTEAGLSRPAAAPNQLPTGLGRNSHPTGLVSDTAVLGRQQLTPEQYAQLQYDYQRAAMGGQIAVHSSTKRASPPSHVATNSAPTANVSLPFAPPQQGVHLQRPPQQLYHHQQSPGQAHPMTRQHVGPTASMPGLSHPQRIVSQPLRATQSIHIPPQQGQYPPHRSHTAQPHARHTVPFPALSPRNGTGPMLPNAAIASMELSANRPKPRLLRSRSRSRHANNHGQSSASGTSGSETETGMDSDTTMTPHRIKKNSGSLSQPNLTSLRSRLEGWAGDVAMQNQGGIGLANGQSGQAGLSARMDDRSHVPVGRPVASHQGGGLGLSVEQDQQVLSNGTISPPNEVRSLSRRSSYKKVRTPPAHASSLPSSPGLEGRQDLPRRSPSRSFTHLSSLRLSPVTSTTNFGAHYASGPDSADKASASQIPRRGSGPETSPAYPVYNRRISTGTRGSDDSLGSFGSHGSGDSMRPVPVGAGAASSEDADDSLDSTSTGDASSPSSGSLSFEPRRRNMRWRGHSQGEVRDKERLSSFGSAGKSSLGLSFDDIRPNFAPRVTALAASTDNAEAKAGTTSRESRKASRTTWTDRVIVQTWHRVVSLIWHVLGIGSSNMWSLRMLSVFPAVWGWLVLMQAAITGGLWVDVYPWGVDTSREALDRLIMGGKAEGRWEAVQRGDMLLASAWVRDADFSPARPGEHASMGKAGRVT